MFTFPSWDFIINAIAPFLITLLIMMVIDVVLGIVIAIVGKTFTTEKLTNYIQSDLLPILGWLALRILLLLPTAYIPNSAGLPADLAWGVYATVFLKIFGSILGSISAIGILNSIAKPLGVEKARVTPPPSG